MLRPLRQLYMRVSCGDSKNDADTAGRWVDALRRNDTPTGTTDNGWRRGAETTSPRQDMRIAIEYMSIRVRKWCAGKAGGPELSRKHQAGWTSAGGWLCTDVQPVHATASATNRRAAQVWDLVLHSYPLASLVSTSRESNTGLLANSQALYR